MSLFKNEHVQVSKGSLINCSNSASQEYAVKIPAFIYRGARFITTVAGNVSIFTAPLDITYGSFKVVQAVYSLDGSAASGAILDVQKVASGTDLANGTSILNANININTATLKTPALANLIPTVLAAGQRVAVIVTGTLTGLVGLSVEIVLERV